MQSGGSNVRFGSPELPQAKFYEAFFAPNEYDKGMRGYPSGRRHSLSEAGTKIGKPRQGKTSCSRNIVIVSPALINPPMTADSE